MPRAVRSLGEIALRVSDLEVMRDFYERVVGLELMRQFPGVAFFRLGDGYGGHTTILALFFRDPEDNLVEFVCRDPELRPQ
jgi:catechol-2,3-dioxygenase